MGGEKYEDSGLKNEQTDEKGGIEVGSQVFGLSTWVDGDPFSEMGKETGLGIDRSWGRGEEIKSPVWDTLEMPIRYSREEMWLRY